MADDDVVRLCRHMKAVTSCMLCACEEAIKTGEPQPAGTFFGFPLLVDPKMARDHFMLVPSNQPSGPAADKVTQDEQADRDVRSVMLQGVMAREDAEMLHGPSIETTARDITEKPVMDATAGVFEYEPVAVARNTDPLTSHEAAASVTTIRKSQEFVLGLLRARGPSTDEELWNFYVPRRPDPVRISPSGMRTRRSELVKRGLVKDTGERRTMSTGRRAIVWGIA